MCGAGLNSDVSIGEVRYCLGTERLMIKFKVKMNLGNSWKFEIEYTFSYALPLEVKYSENYFSPFTWKNGRHKYCVIHKIKSKFIYIYKQITIIKTICQSKASEYISFLVYFIGFNIYPTHNTIPIFNNFFRTCLFFLIYQRSCNSGLLGIH